MTASSGQPSRGQAHDGSVEDTVNDALTPKRRRAVIENSEYAAFARRVLRAYSRRIATGDVESLTHLVALADDINDAIQQAVNGLRAAGYSGLKSVPDLVSPVRPPSNAGADRSRGAGSSRH